MIDQTLFTPVTPPTARDLHGRLVFRDRAWLPPCDRFGPAPDGFDLYITKTAKQQMVRVTRATAPSEAFGWLTGRAFQDQLGRYTIVTDVVYAEPHQAGPAHVRLTPEEITDLRRRAVTANPNADEIGWTHSHLQPSGYSQEDRREQTTWPDDVMVGVVTFMQRQIGEPWARAYRGPFAEELVLSGSINGARETEQPSLVAIAGDAANGAGSAPTAPVTLAEQPWARGAPRQPSSAPLIAAIAFLFLVGLGFLTLDTSAETRRWHDRVVTLEQQLLAAEARMSEIEARVPATASTEQPAGN